MALNRHDAAVQRSIESIQFNHIKEKLQIPDLRSNPKLALPDNPNCIIIPDFYSESSSIIGEIYSHLGKLKPAQLHKIAADILKMLLWEKVIEIPMKKYITVCSEQVYKQLKGISNLAETIRRFNVELLYLPLSPEMEEQLRIAMKRQK